MANRSSSASPVRRSDYADAGVNIDAGNRAVELMADAVKSTYGPEVLAGIGAFGGLYDAGGILRAMRSPVLVSSTDGVGTKVKLAAQAGRYASIGEDIVNHCVNDILVQGARPLFFLDYFATSSLQPEITAAVVTGAAKACREAGCALIGGETAEMPGVYLPGELDVAGTIVGVVDRGRILPRADLRPGDLLIGIRSSGPHTNGYSLLRRIFQSTPLETVFPEIGVPLGDALLAPHRSYLSLIGPLLSSEPSTVKALAHLTGGGWIENPPRVFPEGIGAEVRLGSWPVSPLFALIQRLGEVNSKEMYRVFNMGIGMLVVVGSKDADEVQRLIPEETWVVGELVAGEQRVILK
jgi:phosphoribosylformylglycinamidine cyclo-ligase